ncbi:MAG: putative zinc protease [Phycisphaerae bacterium]|nr:putative zinc protease [Phycisphaerae bacterium]
MPAPFEACELPNGLRIVCEPMASVQSAALGFLVRTGSRHELPEEHGISHFLEHMCFKGTAKRDSHQVNVRFDELGSIYNAFTSKDHTFYYGWVPALRTSEQLELLADILRPSIPPDGFETERQVILEEIAMSDDSFEKHVANTLHEQVFGDHPLAHEILGDDASLTAMTRVQMLAYHRQRYAADNVVLVAAGAIDPQTLFADARRLCAAWNTGLQPRDFPAPTSFTPGVSRTVLPQFQQQCIILAYPSVPEGHADEESIEAFCAIFGGANSRCYWNIVQKGICSQAGAAWIAYADCGIMALYAYGEPERCDEILAALRHEAAEIVRGGVRVDEVQRVKNHRRTHLALEAEAPRSRITQIADDIEIFGRPRSVGERLAAAEAVSQDSIADHLARFPITGESRLISVGPRDWP